MDPFSGLDHDYLASQSFYLVWLSSCLIMELFSFFVHNRKFAAYILTDDALKLAWTLEHTSFYVGYCKN